MSLDHYTPRGQDLSRGWHEVGHYFLARDCGLAVTCMSIDLALAKRQCGDKPEGYCTIPDLHRAPISDQVAVLRAGIVAADMAGLPNIDGARPCVRNRSGQTWWRRRSRRIMR